MGKAIQDLRNEHESILYVLQILDKMMVSNKNNPNIMLKYYGELLYFLKIFADKCHHGKEENILFKELISRGIRNEGGPIGAMLQDHTLGRNYITQMEQNLEKKDTNGFIHAASQYRDLLRQHIQKENDGLFVAADKIFNEQEQNHLFEQFEKHEENVIGHGVHEKLHAMIDTWAKIFLP